jgi:hypothetical protein
MPAEEFAGAVFSLSPQAIEMIQAGLIVSGAVISGIGFVWLLYTLSRLLWRKPSPQEKASQRDHAHMMILLQTMRDILDEQKALAEELNTTLDQKMKHVRETVGSASSELEELRTGLRRVAQNVARTQARLAEIEDDDVRQPSSAQGVQLAPEAGQAAAEAVPLEKSKPAPPPVPRPEPPAEEPAPEGQAEEAPVSALHEGLDELHEEEPAGQAEEEEIETPRADRALAKDEPQGTPSHLRLLKQREPEEEPAEPDILDSWVGLDEEDEEEQPPAESESEDPEAAREAFRQLLSLGEEHAEAEVASQPANPRPYGFNDTSPMQTRVYEYHDAGMTTSQIARELGIGKGEVRLILSIRKDRM